MTAFNEHKCMEYSYQILTGRKTFEEVLDEDVEEYEKCQEILEVKQLAKLIQE